MYWEEKPDAHNPIVAQNIRRTTFLNVLSVLHFSDNSAESSDRFFKVRLLFENLNKQSLKYMPPSSNVSVDEIMCPYYGSHGDKQYIRGKPVR